MIDQITLKSCIGKYTDGDLSRFDRIGFAKNATLKMKPTVNFINSPVTGAQMEVLPTVEEIGGILQLCLAITIPVAAALAGQNLVHNGSDGLQVERSLIRKLLKWILSSYGYGEHTISAFIKKAEVELLELTWHTATASRAAARSLQVRTIAHVTSLEQLTGRHDILVANVHVVKRADKTCALVTFKDGSQFRQYIKAEQATSRTKHNRRACFVSKEMRPHFAQMLTAIDGHVRNEVIMGKKVLEAFDLVRPHKWSAASVQRAIEHVMHMARFDQRRPRNMKELDIEGLSAEVVETARRYFDRMELSNWMSKQSFSRHRKLLLEKHLDIAEALPTSKSKSISRGGMQLSYRKRWGPPPALSELAICQSRVEAIEALLEPPPQPIRDVSSAVRIAVRAAAPPGIVGRHSKSTTNTDRSQL